MANFFSLNLNLVHSVLKTRLQYWIHTRVKEIVCMCVGAIFFILYFIFKVCLIGYTEKPQWLRVYCFLLVTGF